MKNSFYQLTNNSNDSEAELYIYGDITSWKWYEDDVCAYDLAKELNSLEGKNLKVRINSYGGEVAQGLAIYNLLKDYQGQVLRVLQHQSSLWRELSEKCLDLACL